MEENRTAIFAKAKQDFLRARRQAVLKVIVGRLTGAPVNLLSYDEVRQQVKAHSSIYKGSQDIPLDAIVGSVNRYTDFTRDFLPLKGILAERWANVEIASSGMVGLPPIEVYKIGDVYFVKDGNHRVSVARQIGATHIQAFVTEVQSRVHLTPEDNPEDIILKVEYAQFMENTHLDKLRPEANLKFTVPGQYEILEEHIAVHRYYMGLENKRKIPQDEAVTHWYDAVYSPIQKIIDEKAILRDFPDRTEADLYLWIAEHRHALEEEFGRKFDPSQVADHLAAQFSSRPERVAGRIEEKLIDSLMPAQLGSGPATGVWRRERRAEVDQERLFPYLLVPINGKSNGWSALDQAIDIAGREGSHIQGLHVIKPGRSTRGRDPSLESIQSEFQRRCEAAKIPARLLVVEGNVSDKIIELARWYDLTIVNLSYPPAPRPIAALSSGFRLLLQRCPTPVLTIPQKVISFHRILLAYDGSPKAHEALFIAAYLGCRWDLPLVVVSVIEPDRVTDDTQEEARSYLENYGLQAEYIRVRGPVAESLLIVTEEEGCDLLLMGGYGRSLLLDAVLGSSVDHILRISRKPILVCR
jgi:nucleotide-binding universal stress UspA family protein